MRLNDVLPGPSNLRRRICDIVVQWSGIYRLWVLLHHSTISLSARVVSPSRLQVGRDVTIQGGAIIHCGGKRWSGYCGYVRLCHGVKIGPQCVVYGAGGVVLDQYVHLGPGVKIMSQGGQHDAARLSASPTFTLQPVHIGAGSWIGTGAVILGGAKIGRCVTVAPNSVVSGVVSDYDVVVGNPARVIFKNKVLDQ